MSADPPPVTDEARARARAVIDAARAELIASIEGLPEREFDTAPDGEPSITTLLAELAVEERRTLARLAGRPDPAPLSGRAIPPQVIHDLAGTRHAATAMLDAAGEGDLADVIERVGSIAAREAELARIIRERRGAGASGTA